MSFRDMFGKEAGMKQKYNKDKGFIQGHWSNSEIKDRVKLMSDLKGSNFTVDVSEASWSDNNHYDGKYSEPVMLLEITVNVDGGAIEKMEISLSKISDDEVGYKFKTPELIEASTRAKVNNTFDLWRSDVARKHGLDSMTESLERSANKRSTPVGSPRPEAK